MCEYGPWTHEQDWLIRLLKCDFLTNGLSKLRLSLILQLCNNNNNQECLKTIKKQTIFWNKINRDQFYNQY